MDFSSRCRTHNLLLIGLAYAAVIFFGLYGSLFEPLTRDPTPIAWFAANEFARPATPRPGLALAPAEGPAQPLIRPTTRRWDDAPASYALNYLVQHALRWWRGHAAASALRRDVSEDGLFSSRHPRGLLVYAEDFT